MLVLIVEDEVLIAMYLEALVLEFGHQVSAVASSAAEAISCADTCRPDVALMDIRLSQGSSGIDAARELHRRQGVRCIFLSANLDQTARLAAAACAPIAFIGKPILPITLKRALQRAEAEAG